MPPPPTPSRIGKPRRRSRFILMSILLALVAGGSYIAWDRYFRPVDETAGYQFLPVSRGSVEDVVTATGTLQPRDYVDVGAQVSGVLTRILVEVGSEVQAGDLLAEIDPTVLQSRVDATRAQLRNQRAQLTDRESSLQLAQIQLRRQQNLMAEDATTEEALQTAEAGLRSARAQIEALKAQIDQTESNLRADEANLEYTRIYAPMTGTVVSITARQGQTLNANQQAPTILRIADLSTMTVQSQVSEADVTRIRPGMEVYFTTLGNASQRWNSTLRKIEPTPTVTNNVVLYNAIFDVPNANRRLMTQMTAQVFFVVARAEDVLTVPMAAVSGLASGTRRPSGSAGPSQSGAVSSGRGMRADRASTQSGAAEPEGPARQASTRSATVRVLGSEGRLEERKVTIGVTSRIVAEVREGLTEGEQVVAGLRPGGAPGQAQAGQTPRLPGR